MRLDKSLRMTDVFCISSGAMISSGLFVLPGLAHAQAGPAVVLSYLLAALLAMTGMFSIAELATAMPKAGGDYFFVNRTMGPAAGTVSGLLTWLSISLKSAFALAGMSAFITLFADVDMRLTGAALTLLFTLINCRGAREAGRLQVVLVLFLFLLMIFYVGAGFRGVNIDHFKPFAPYGPACIFSTAGMVFIAFGGILKTASVAEEVQDPGRIIPRALIMSLFVVSVFYVLMVFVTSGLLPAEKLDGNLMPISEGARVFGGRPAFIAMSVAAILAFVSTANAGILAASRYLLAMSRDHLLPSHLARTSGRQNMPRAAIAITGAVVAGALCMELGLLVKAASAVLITTYILANLSLIVLRESRVQNYRPAFRSPLYPWMQIIGVAGCFLLLFEMGMKVLQIEVGLIVIGLFVYWFYGSVKAGRDFALLHLVARLTAREMGSNLLETELKTIIRERDEIVEDRFDQIIEKCMVLDLPKRTTLAAFFKAAAESLAGPTAMPADKLQELMLMRELESNTAISPEVAIPHVLIEGEHQFHILLARCRKGIDFSAEAPAVKAVFVLAGTRDDRNFHLRALAGIAQIVQDQDFLKRWMAAQGKQQLRDVVLLAKRQRG